ncbi:hypothetical protein GIB67_035045 [Kingdonia uniflora]|uniref:Prolamin-like domain-containing protein n=1 Tax=Kingdonia uniflora TaxID=39325 RepID=A0A7J7L1I5_9MAGN|nr:hypothetical protein GIB67_035045 [Kingdonia uniflora]
MMKVTRQVSLILLIVACVAISISPIQAQSPLIPGLPFPNLPSPSFPLPGLPSPGLLPPGLGQEIQQCLSSLQSVQGCYSDIFSSITRGQVHLLSPACCKAIASVSTSCWQKLFPFYPQLPSMLNGFCATQAPSPPASTTTTTSTTIPIRSDMIVAEIAPGPIEYDQKALTVKLGPEIKECLSTIRSVEGCMEIISSFLSAQVRLIGPSCCKAIVKLSDKCLPKIFPSNPLFPPLIKNFCGRLVPIPN